MYELSCFIVVTIVLNVVTINGILERDSLPFISIRAISPNPISIGMYVVMMAMYEELFFRSYLPSVLSGSVDTRTADVICALVFGLVHSIDRLQVHGLSKISTMLHVLNCTSLGLYLSQFESVFGRFLIHMMFNNFVVCCWFMCRRLKQKKSTESQVHVNSFHMNSFRRDLIRVNLRRGSVEANVNPYRPVSVFQRRTDVSMKLSEEAINQWEARSQQLFSVENKRAAPFNEAIKQLEALGQQLVSVKNKHDTPFTQTFGKSNI